MRVNNSLEVYTSLYWRLLQDIADCYTDSEPGLDWAKAQSRFSREGIAFFTKTLPRLGKAFDLALQGRTRFLFTGFQKDPVTGVPKFLGWLLKRVFSEDSNIRSDANVQAIKHVRQLLYFMYKLELPYEQKTCKKVIDSFVSVEEEIKNLSIPESDPIVSRARVLITRVLSGHCPRNIVPRHGPGSVSTGELGGEKSHFSRLYAALEREFPFTEYFRLSALHTVDTYDEIQALEPLETGTAKVVLVPKDSRGPRLISCEPLEYQWIQQGLQRKLYSIVENHWITKGFVNFTDQEVNRRLALESSHSQEWVTLDMKDASDRVSVELVKNLFRDSGWLDALLASRSTHTRLPDGGTVELAKFAPMGSAVCFPIEALCFYALSVSVLVVYRGYRWQDAIRSVYVYGDDLIVKRADYALILQHLPRFGLMFNESKCCTSGFFRESCGCDAYKGIDVTPIRLRTRWSRRRTQDPSVLVSYVALHNAMYDSYHRRTAAYIREIVEDLYGLLPFLEYKEVKKSYSQSTSSPPGRVIGWYCSDVNPITENQKRVRRRFNPHLHRLEVFGFTVQPVHKKYRESGWDACLRRLTCGSTGLRTGLYAVARRSRLKRTWGAVTL